MRQTVGYQQDNGQGRLRVARKVVSEALTTVVMILRMFILPWIKRFAGSCSFRVFETDAPLPSEGDIERASIRLTGRDRYFLRLGQSQRSSQPRNISRLPCPRSQNSAGCRSGPKGMDGPRWAHCALARHNLLSSSSANQQIGNIALATHLRRRTKGIHRLGRFSSDGCWLASFYERTAL
jgi:hypothetical protein